MKPIRILLGALNESTELCLNIALRALGYDVDIQEDPFDWELRAQRIWSVLFERLTAVEDADLQGRAGVDSSFQPLLILQEVDPIEFDRLSRNSRRFELSWKESDVPKPTVHDRSNPLLFRQTLRALSAADQGSGRDGALWRSFSAISLPIVFVGHFELPVLLGRVPPPQPHASDRLFLDHSIWHRFVALDNKALVNLHRVLCEITRYVGESRYQMVTALECLDYSIRMFQNQVLFEAPRDRDMTGHGSHVAVHGLHSETESSEHANCLQSCVFQALVDLPVRLLLVDDHAPSTHKMRTIDTQSDNAPSKGQLLYRELIGSSRRREAFPEIVDATADKMIVCARTVQAAIEILNSKTAPDIILLDYLLASENPQADREYGIDLIHKLIASDGSVKRGPLERHWVVPISAFPNAFESEVSRGSISTIGAQLLLASGADIVCSPHLFRYKFFRLLATMKEQAVSQPPQEIEDILGEIASRLPLAETEQAIRGHAQGWYARCVAVRSRKRTLTDGADRGSPFSAWVAIELEARLPECLLEHFCELLRQLWVSPNTDWKWLCEEADQLRLCVDSLGNDTKAASAELKWLTTGEVFDSAESRIHQEIARRSRLASELWVEKSVLP